MARAIARDGEGASKFLEVKVTGAESLLSARLIARSVCSSSLVKAAMYGQDANWEEFWLLRDIPGQSLIRKARIFI